MTDTATTTTIDRYALRRYNRRAERRAILAADVRKASRIGSVERRAAEYRRIVADAAHNAAASAVASVLDSTRSSEDGAGVEDWFVSYDDDPWTPHATLQAKHNAELRAEFYEYTTQAGTGWWGEWSTAGFGAYAPADLADATDAESQRGDFDAAETVAIEDDPMVPTETKLVAARLAAGLNESGGWYRTGDSDEAIPSWTIDDEIAEFGGIESAGAYDPDYTIEHAVLDGASYRADR